MSKNYPTIPYTPPQPASKEDIALQAKMDSLLEYFQSSYAEDIYRSIVAIAYDVAIVGLPVKEACILNDIDYETFLQMQTKDPKIKQLMDKKILEYKRSLLKVVSLSAKTNDKVALDLLMARFPDEFNRRKGGGPGEEAENTNNFINMAVQFVQTNGDARPLIPEHSGNVKEVTNKKFQMLTVSSPTEDEIEMEKNVEGGIFNNIKKLLK